MTRTLLILRHAKSSWSDPDLDDFDRPLNKRGRKAVPEMGKKMASRGIQPDLIVSSPANRAITTASGIAPYIGYDPEDIARESSLYMAAWDQILEVVREQSDDVRELMIVGHNPGLTAFANHVAGAEIDNIPTAGLVSAQVHYGWGELSPGGASFHSFMRPRRK